ncbi:uncharacterized protein LOC116620492 [Nematostella vectensis]|uniref:uncharacterized protein LOC116620492 n=1 Tax=Nematostella vectensis TaxID=45351 RepID=UPI0020777FD8|nr:uncharacterized protein LOC116620492 [Nematostella vectensis]
MAFRIRACIWCVVICAAVIVTAQDLDSDIALSKRGDSCSTNQQVQQVITLQNDVLKVLKRVFNLQDLRPQPTRWQIVTRNDIQRITRNGVTVTESTDGRGGVVVSGQVTMDGSGCGNPDSALQILIRGEWTQIRYTQEFYGAASCWSIFGRGSNLEVFDETKGDAIFDQLHMNNKNNNTAFDGKDQRCDNDADNFWHTQNGQGLRRATVMLRRNTAKELAGIVTTTGCGTPRYVIKNIYVLQ